MGDEDPRLSQTALAEREAERDRVSQAAAVAAIGLPEEELEEAEEGEEPVAVVEEPEEEEEELDDSAPLVSAGPARGRAPDDDLLPTSPLGGLRATMTDDGEIVVDEVTDEEVPVAAEEDDVDEGYVLEDEDEELAEEAEEDEGPLVHSTDDDY
jgi:hypothetical protein